MGAFLVPIFADRVRGFVGPIQYAGSVGQLSEFRVASGCYPQLLFRKLWHTKTLGWSSCMIPPGGPASTTAREGLS